MEKIPKKLWRNMKQEVACCEQFTAVGYNIDSPGKTTSFVEMKTLYFPLKYTGVYEAVSQ